MRILKSTLKRKLYGKHTLKILEIKKKKNSYNLPIYDLFLITLTEFDGFSNFGQHLFLFDHSFLYHTTTLPFDYQLSFNSTYFIVILSGPLFTFPKNPTITKRPFFFLSNVTLRHLFPLLPSQVRL